MTKMSRKPHWDLKLFYIQFASRLTHSPSGSIHCERMRFLRHAKVQSCMCVYVCGGGQRGIPVNFSCLSGAIGHCSRVQKTHSSRLTIFLFLPKLKRPATTNINDNAISGTHYFDILSTGKKSIRYRVVQVCGMMSNDFRNLFVFAYRPKSSAYDRTFSSPWLCLKWSHVCEWPQIDMLLQPSSTRAPHACVCVYVRNTLNTLKNHNRFNCSLTWLTGWLLPAGCRYKT